MLGLCLLSLVAGCGTGEYQARMEKQIAALRELARFNDLQKLTYTLPATNVTLRVHQKLEGPVDMGGRSSFGASIPSAEIQPPGWRMPGQRATARMFVKDNENREWPVYCYFGEVAVPALADGAKLFREFVKGTLEQTKVLAVGNWEEVQIKQPGGNLLPCWRIRAVGEMPFLLKSGGPSGAPATPGSTGPQAAKTSGVLQIYIPNNDLSLVLIGWLAPQIVETASGIDDKVQLTVGTVAVQPLGDLAMPSGTALGPELNLGAFAISLPQKFIKMDQPPPDATPYPKNVQVVHFSLNATTMQNGLPTLEVAVVPEPFVESLLNLAVSSRSVLYENWYTQKNEMGLVNGRRVGRMFWGGTSRKGGNADGGWIYAYSDNGQGVIIQGWQFDSYQPSYLPAFEAVGASYRPNP